MLKLLEEFKLNWTNARRWHSLKAEVVTGHWLMRKRIFIAIFCVVATMLAFKRVNFMDTASLLNAPLHSEFANVWTIGYVSYEHESQTLTGLTGPSKAKSFTVPNTGSDSIWIESISPQNNSLSTLDRHWALINGSYRKEPAGHMSLCSGEFLVSRAIPLTGKLRL